MFNSEKPSLDELPTTAQLIRSTIIAAITALVILFLVILPAEYAIDPTGIGRILGLSEMGDIKLELEKEAEEDLLKHGKSRDHSSLINNIFSLFISTAQAEQVWKDTITFTLPPGASAETKLMMEIDNKAKYNWTTEGGRINYDLHGHGNEESVEYERGRGKASGHGTIEAPFRGEHGWFWRNRDRKDVSVTLRLSCEYSKVIQSK